MTSLDFQCGLSTGQCASLACLWEAMAPKPGNVHRGADFQDLTFYDFAISAVAIEPLMESACGTPLGQTILRSVAATQWLVETNTNLGTILLLAPLATVSRNVPLEQVSAVLSRLTAQDAHDVYQAIRHAQPGGLGVVDSMDVASSPPDSLVEAMRLAADRDLVARQYTNDFAQVLQTVVPSLVESRRQFGNLPTAIVHTHLQIMHQWPDSLIARKCGPQIARQSAQMAGQVVGSGPPDSEDYQRALSDLDFWLRSDHHRRNPGTTADLVAAGLFAALRDGRIQPPLR